MSWIDDIESKSLTIITGDGKEWTPLWKNAQKDVEYNASVFEFVNVEGSLVLRQKPKGRKFELELYFTGENAVLIGNAFEYSARDSRVWTIKHPFFGDFKGQPLSLKQDNSVLNVSKINVSIVETITDTYPQPSIVYGDLIQSQTDITNDAQAVAYGNSKELDKVSLQNDVSVLDTYLSKVIKSGEELKEFKTAVSDAVNEITNVLSTGASILRSIQAIINYPATIEQTVEARFNALKEAFNVITDNFENKNQYEAIAGGLISAMFLCSSVHFENDFDTRQRIFNHQGRLSTIFSQYVNFLDSLQTDRADSDNSYIPSFSGLNELNALMGLTMSNLYNIAFTAKQEREHTLESDSNVIMLTHRFYGLDKKDINIDKFISTNNIGIKELINIRKGRKIIYYV